MRTWMGDNAGFFGGWAIGVCLYLISSVLDGDPADAPVWGLLLAWVCMGVGLFLDGRNRRRKS